MPSLYVAVYLARPPVPGRTSEIAATHAAVQSGFPYDAADDPSFFSAWRHGGPITWGVCRPDVRCAIRKDDGIVFFSAQKDSQDIKATQYRFVAALRVADKMQHTALSEHPNFSRYLNLLIRPCGAGWEHYEPVAKHDDWLWRVTCRSLVRSLGFRKKEKHWEAAGKTHTPGNPLTIDEHLFPVASNYVVFSTSSAVLAHDPPLVARHREGETHEIWESDSTSEAIRGLVFRNSCRCLRTSNLYQPHRRIHYPHLEEADLEETLRRFRALVRPNL
jgi:hypothetical protein